MRRDRIPPPRPERGRQRGDKGGVACFGRDVDVLEPARGSAASDEGARGGAASGEGARGGAAPGKGGGAASGNGGDTVSAEGCTGKAEPSHTAAVRYAPHPSNVEPSSPR